MKEVLFAFLFVVSISSVWAQTDTLSPKWKEGLVWKVTSKTVAPDRNSVGSEKELTYNTTVIQFLWEIFNVNDTAVNISLLPLKINVESESNETLQDSRLVFSGYDKLSTGKIPMIYQANLDGTIRKRDIQDENALLLKNEYFTNESELMAVFPEDTLEDEDYEYEEYNEDEMITGFQGASLEYWSVLEFVTKIIEAIHSPYGEPVFLDSVINIQDYPEEKWETYQKGLSSMAKMMEVEGYTTFTKDEGVLTNKFELVMNLGSMIKQLAKLGEDQNGKKKGKKGKKETKEQAAMLDAMKMEMKINGNFTLDEVSFFPIKFLTEFFTSISAKGENASFKAVNELIFE